MLVRYSNFAEQAPCGYACDAPPISAMSDAPIGTRVSSQIYGRRILSSTPVSAGPVGDRVSTVSRQSGANPAPIPQVGTVSPQACSDVPSIGAAAPKSSWGGLAIFAGIVIALWFFAGMSLRRFV